jgi:hypothetical protein
MILYFFFWIRKSDESRVQMINLHLQKEGYKSDFENKKK